MPKRDQEPEFFPADKVDTRTIEFGMVAICPKCRARPREFPCKRCGGSGIVPNKGAIPFVKPVGTTLKEKEG